MDPQFQQYLPVIVIAAAVVVLFAIWLFLRANRKTTIIGDETGGKDVLDEGGTKAARNQALIDAPTAVKQDFGEMSANANSDEVNAACAVGDAEAGTSVAPSVVKAVPPSPEAQPAPVPSADPAPEPSPAPTGDADDLRKIKGVGPKLVTILAEQGVTRFDQIAAWSESDIDRVDATLGRFSGRIRRDQWVEQAKFLAAGDDAGFAERFGQNR